MFDLPFASDTSTPSDLRGDTQHEPFFFDFIQVQNLLVSLLLSGSSGFSKLNIVLVYSLWAFLIFSDTQIAVLDTVDIIHLIGTVSIF